MLTIYFCGQNVKVPREFDYPIPCAHPKDQVAFARSIAKRVNAGEDIHLATNSDHMVKEFNILIGLWGKPELADEWGYSPDEVLHHSDVICYDGEPCDINQPEGIELKSVDEVIDRQNNICDAIFWRD